MPDGAARFRPSLRTSFSRDRQSVIAQAGNELRLAQELHDKQGRYKLSRLNGWPMRTPVNASPRPSRATAHDSGPMCIATPSSQGTCTLYSLPVSRRFAYLVSVAAIVRDRSLAIAPKISKSTAGVPAEIRRACRLERLVELLGRHIWVLRRARSVRRQNQRFDARRGARRWIASSSIGEIRFYLGEVFTDIVAIITITNGCAKGWSNLAWMRSGAVPVNIFLRIRAIKAFGSISGASCSLCNSGRQYAGQL
jgi:hypothetical protein